MADVRALVLDTARAACDLVAAPEVAAVWDEPSALPQFTARGLAVLRALARRERDDVAALRVL